MGTRSLTGLCGANRGCFSYSMPSTSGSVRWLQHSPATHLHTACPSPQGRFGANNDPQPHGHPQPGGVFHGWV